MIKVTTIELDHPVTVKTGDKEDIINSVELRRPKVKDIKGIDLEKIEGDSLVTLVGRLSGLDSHIFSEIDVTDFLKMAEAIGGFFPKPSPKSKVKT